jgi:hypothetical protein
MSLIDLISYVTFILDPQKDQHQNILLENKVLYVVLFDLQESLNQLWDTLPIDSVISSILDPRTKWHERIPTKEITEALKTMQEACLNNNNNNN